MMSHRPRDETRLRAWLEHVAQTAIDWLDQLDAAAEDLEDDGIDEDGGDRELAPEEVGYG